MRKWTPQNIGYWLSNIIIMNLIMLGPWALVARMLHEVDKLSNTLWASGIIIVQMVVIGIAVGYIVIQDLFHHLAFVVVEKIDNEDDLSKLVNWLCSTWSIRNVTAFALLFASLCIYLGVIRFGHNQEFPGFGFTLSVITTGLLGGMGFYVTCWVSFLAYNLGKYQYAVDDFFTADSEIVRKLSETLTRNEYALAGYFGLFTLFGSSRLMDPAFRETISIPFLVIVCVVISAQFILTRRTLGGIVNQAKLKTLGGIRSRIHSLELKGDIAEKETAEKILRLMDIYERVKTVKSETFDLRSVSTFVSQLMLPLLAWLLGNQDKLQGIFPFSLR